MIGKKRKCIAPTDEVDLETLRQLKGLDKPQKEVDEEDLVFPKCCSNTKEYDI